MTEDTKAGLTVAAVVILGLPLLVFSIGMSLVSLTIVARWFGVGIQ